MSRYLNVAGFTARSIMPSADIALLESVYSGWLQARLDARGAWLNSRLAKRYAVPFGTEATPTTDPRTDVPEAILDWIVRMVTREAYFKRGAQPSGGLDASIMSDAETAFAEVREAADAKAGLFELPLKASDSGDGISKGGPLSYSEASPYTWTTEQRETVQDE